MSSTSPGPRDHALPATRAAYRSEREPVLAIPEGWVIDDLARERLARQLARARTTSAASSPRPARSRREPATGSTPSGCASSRSRSPPRRASSRGTAPSSCDPESRSRCETASSRSRAGRLLVDPGAHVHDPWRPIAPLEDASPLGRPPFPRRPVVVFLACEPEVEALDWARSLVNNLVRRDVEGRLAMLDIAEGLHLTQPCLPSEESIRALRPDVIVALDQAALDQVPGWCDDRPLGRGRRVHTRRCRHRGARLLAARARPGPTTSSNRPPDRLAEPRVTREPPLLRAPPGSPDRRGHTLDRDCGSTRS